MSSKRGTKNTARKSTTRNGPPKEDKVSYEEESDGTLCMIVENGETRKRSKLGELTEEVSDGASDTDKGGDAKESNGSRKTTDASTAEQSEEKTKAEASGAGESAESELESLDSEEEKGMKSSKEKIDKGAKEIKNDHSDTEDQ